MATPKELPMNGSILGPTLRFKGELQADEDLQIRGLIEGTIRHTKRLLVCADGRVKADIHGEAVVVEGLVEGDVEASASIVLQATANLTGDLHAPNVSIAPGARFNGSVLMQNAAPAQPQQPPPPPAQAAAPPAAEPAPQPPPAPRNPTW